MPVEIVFETLNLGDNWLLLASGDGVQDILLFLSQVPFIVNTLWDALLELDDLTASTNSIMTLLSSLLTYPQVRQCR